MKVAAIFGKEQAGVVEKPDPRPKDDFVVVKLHSVPMCTEYHAFSSGRTGEAFGHEGAGEVVAVDKAAGVRVGDRVVVQPQTTCGECYLCRSGDYIHCQTRIDVKAITGCDLGTSTMAQYAVRQEALLSPIPEGVSYDHAGLAVCGLGPTFGAMQLMDVDREDTVLIVGLGPVGLGGVINARWRGARVIGVESHPYRASLATALGAEVVVDPHQEDALDRIRRMTDGFGAGTSIDCTGDPAGQRLAFDGIRRKGHMAFVGGGGKLELIGARDTFAKGATLHGAWHYNLNDYPKLMRMIRDVPGQLDKQITHTFPLDRIQDAWALQATRNCGKVILHPWQ